MIGKIETSGFAELEKKLLKLEASASKKVMRGALMAALTPILKHAKNAAPLERIKRNLRKKSYINKKNKFRAEAGIVVRKFRKSDMSKDDTGKLRDDPRNAWFWHFFEFGTADRKQKKTGRRTGQINAQPFIRPAFDSKKDEAVAKFAAELKKRIDKASR